MIESGTIRFFDKSSNDEACVIVSYDVHNVFLALSLKSDGDIEVMMSKAEARELVANLQKALL